MEYNTKRQKIEILDYGRHVYKLVQYAKTIEDRAQRTRLAESIVAIMAQVNPRVREHGDYRRKLWDHLMVLAGGNLDVDTPFPVNHRTSVNFQPKHLNYNRHNIRYRHYGGNLERMVQQVSLMPQGPERDALEHQLAQTMKRSYLAWNRDSVDDQLIRTQLHNISGGQINLPSSQPIILPFPNSQPDDFGERRQNKKRKKKK